MAAAKRRNRPASGSLAHDFHVVLVMALAQRLQQSGSKYYFRHWRIGLTEHRLILALGKKDGIAVGKLAAIADLDKAAVSRGLKLLEQNGFIATEQTATRGRAVIVTLTAAGRNLQKELLAALRRRDKRFVKGFSPAECVKLRRMIERLIANIAYMNQE